MTDQPSQPPGGDERPYGRRAFLGVIGVGVSSLWWGDAAFRGVSDALQPVTARAPKALRNAIPSPSSGWRIYAVNPPMPTFDAATWRLTVNGLVEQPLTLSYEDLRGLAVTKQTSDFHCVTGWSVQDVRWAGVRLSDLLGMARPAPEATAVSFVSAERPYVDSLLLDQALQPDTMIAYDMDDVPLTRPHGAPARLVIPPMYGYKGVKWVQQITVTRRPEIGFWEQRGYDFNAWVGRSNGAG